MITCGNCKQSHVTPYEVKACYGASGKLPEVALPTPNTVDFRDALAKTETWGGAAVTSVRLGPVPEGTYTIVFDESKDDRITLRVRPHWDEGQVDTQVVDYLHGPDNETNFTGCAFLTPYGRYPFSIWKRFRGAPRLEKAMHALIAFNNDELSNAGFEYAVRSSRCYRCGHKLTVPASVHRGLGPVCAGK